MNKIVTIIIRFLIFVLLQVLVLNQLEIGSGIQILVYPLYILLLPVELGVIPLMLISFLMGICIDAMSNTYGLHTSSILVVAYLRPIVFKLFAPRDGYDPLLETNIFNLGTTWFIKTFGVLLIIHHFWFFMMEMLKLNEVIFVLQKTLLSLPISFLICVLIQYLLINKRTKNEI